MDEAEHGNGVDDVGDDTATARPPAVPPSAIDPADGPAPHRPAPPGPTSDGPPSGTVPTDTPTTPAPAPAPVSPPTSPSGVPDAPAPARPSRRTVLVSSAVALLIGGGAGVAEGFARGPGASSTGTRTALPAALSEAIADERQLLADARGSAVGDDRLVRGIVRDHEAHLAALLAAASDYAPPASHTPSATRSPETPFPDAPRLDRATLRSRERRGAQRAAHNAERLSAAPSALLASIAASEATHAALLQ